MEIKMWCSLARVLYYVHTDICWLIIKLSQDTSGLLSHFKYTFCFLAYWKVRLRLGDVMADKTSWEVEGLGLRRSK